MGWKVPQDTDSAAFQNFQQRARRRKSLILLTNKSKSTIAAPLEADRLHFQRATRTINQMSIQDELKNLADQIGGEHGVTLRKMAGEISAAGERHPRATHLTLVQAANGATTETMARLVTLRQRCGRLGLSLDEFADKPLTVAIVDRAFASGNGSADDRVAVKAALMRENLLHHTGL
jgi:hypothetical protein